MFCRPSLFLYAALLIAVSMPATAQEVVTGDAATPPDHRFSEAAIESEFPDSVIVETQADDTLSLESPALDSVPKPANIEPSSVIGLVIAVSGHASVITSDNPDKAVSIQTDTPINIGDTIITGADSRLHLLLIDDSTFTLGERTRLVLKEFRFEGEESITNKAHYSLDGSFLFQSGLTSDDALPPILIEMPYGSVNVKKATLWGGSLDTEYGIFVQNGQAYVQTNRGRVMLRSGIGILLHDRNAPPYRPTAWTDIQTNAATELVPLTALRDEMGNNGKSSPADIEMMRMRHQAFMDTVGTQGSVHNNGRRYINHNAPRSQIRQSVGGSSAQAIFDNWEPPNTQNITE